MQNNSDSSNGAENPLGINLEEFGLSASQLNDKEIVCRNLIGNYTFEIDNLNSLIQNMKVDLRARQRELQEVQLKRDALVNINNPAYVQAFLEEIQGSWAIQERKIPVNSLQNILDFLSGERKEMRTATLGTILNHFIPEHSPKYAADMMIDHLLAASFSEENKQAGISHVSPDFYTLYRKGFISATPAEIKAITCKGFEECVQEFHLRGQILKYCKFLKLDIYGSNSDHKPFNIDTKFAMETFPQDDRHIKTVLSKIQYVGNFSPDPIEEREFQRKFVRNIVGGLTDKVAPEGILLIDRNSDYELPWFTGILAQDDALLKKTSAYKQVKGQIEKGTHIFDLNKGSLIHSPTFSLSNRER